MGERRKIYEYENYRSFLKDFYDWSKIENPKFSFRFFSKLAGFKSSSFLKHVMDGKKNHSPESIEQFAKAIKFTKEERLFFKNLVLFNQASSSEEKQLYFQEILRSRTYRK